MFPLPPDNVTNYRWRRIEFTTRVEINGSIKTQLEFQKEGCESTRTLPGVAEGISASWNRAQERISKANLVSKRANRCLFLSASSFRTLRETNVVQPLPSISVRRDLKCEPWKPVASDSRIESASETGRSSFSLVRTLLRNRDLSKENAPGFPCSCTTRIKC